MAKKLAFPKSAYLRRKRTGGTPPEIVRQLAGQAINLSEDVRERANPRKDAQKTNEQIEILPSILSSSLEVFYSR